MPKLGIFSGAEICDILRSQGFELDELNEENGLDYFRLKCSCSKGKFRVKLPTSRPKVLAKAQRTLNEGCSRARPTQP
jgi:hypothetical protein